MKYKTNILAIKKNNKTLREKKNYRGIKRINKNKTKIKYKTRKENGNIKKGRLNRKTSYQAVPWRKIIDAVVTYEGRNT